MFDRDLGTFGGDGAGISSFSDTAENAGREAPTGGLVSLGGVEGGAARGNGGGVGNTNGVGGENTLVGSVAVTTVGRDDKTGCSESTGFVGVGNVTSFTDLPDDDDAPTEFFNHDLPSF